MPRNIYLKTIPIPDAMELARQALDRDRIMGVETVPTAEALGRVTAAPVFARASSPTFHSSAMDGIAVKAESTFSARDDNPLELTEGKDFAWVNTGHVVPEFADAVIMIENVVKTSETTVSIEAPAFPWQHVRRIGEDIVTTELILPTGRELGPYELGALLTGGIFELEVHEKVKLAFIPTGDEVLDYTTRPEPGPGQVIESNSVVFVSLAEQAGIQARRVPPVPDSPEALEAALGAALKSEAHIVVVGAGSSAGSKDYTRRTMERFGKVLVHGIAAMPGKPTLLGVADNGKLMVGAPGYPVSAVVCFEKLLEPLAAWLAGKSPAEPAHISATLTRRVPSKLGTTEFVRLTIGRVGDSYAATPLARGAGMITTLTKAQGSTAIAAELEGVEAGEIVDCELYVPKAELDNTLVAVGSHDNTLDIMANELMLLPEPVRLASTHVGSMGGIAALSTGAALVAGAHLFDPETNDFNFPFLKRYAKELEVSVVNLAIRHQGLMVAPGNPKKISGINDLARPDIRFINRQRGAGTRILLDHHLSKAGISPSSVAGYDKEEFTHMAVAVNVLTKTADCGLGIHAAAKALGLDFVPVALERYDLIFPTKYASDPRLKALLTLLDTPDFKQKIQSLGGYETQLTGQYMKPGQGLG